MDQQQQRDPDNEYIPTDAQTDTTRSQNQQASVAASGSSTDRAGSLSEDGSPHQSGGRDHTGGHTEGQYNKEDTGQTMGKAMDSNQDTEATRKNGSNVLECFARAPTRKLWRKRLKL